MLLKETLEKLPIQPNSRIDELLPLVPEQFENVLAFWRQIAFNETINNPMVRV